MPYRLRAGIDRRDRKNADHRHTRIEAQCCRCKIRGGVGWTRCIGVHDIIAAQGSLPLHCRGGGNSQIVRQFDSLSPVEIEMHDNASHYRATVIRSRWLR